MGVFWKAGKGRGSRKDAKGRHAKYAKKKKRERECAEYGRKHYEGGYRVGGLPRCIWVAE